jgi:His-Xaa-Ser system radical SAM maturase HxsC
MELRGRIPKSEGREPFVARITTDRDLPFPLRQNEALLIVDDHPYSPEGFRAVLRIGDAGGPGEIVLPAPLRYLGDGDILRINEDGGEVRVLYRSTSPHNVLFFTERCNSRCLMCSQPPRDIDDGYLIDEMLESIPLMDLGTPELCITGGEPTLLGPRLLEVLRCVRDFLPETALHMLSNGRLFAYPANARAVAEVGMRDLMIGIPLYADVACRHDFVVQAKGAFDQTIRGLMNLARFGVRTEIRFVIHRQTVGRMVETARFITRNLPFVSQVAFMGLEMTGFTKSNLEALWIDPYEYQDQLANAVEEIAGARIRASIYNLPLCLLPERVWRFARQSISDWKNIYLPECEPCSLKQSCAGFFASAPLRYSAHLKPFATPVRMRIGKSEHKVPPGLIG